MLLTEQEVTERYESPLNLLNRLRAATKPRNQNQILSLPPTADQVISDLEEKLNLGSIKSKAASIMLAAMDELQIRLPEVSKPEKLAAIAADMGKVVTSQENKNGDTKIGQVVVYCPIVAHETEYDVIDITSKE